MNGPVFIETRSSPDSATGTHGNVRGYGSTVAFVLGDDGKYVAWYERTRGFRGAEVDAWVRNPETGGRIPVTKKGEHRTLRAAWEAKVREVLS